MTLLDLFLAVPIGILIYIGWKRGVVREAATLVGVLIGIWAAVHFSRLVATLFGLTGEHSILIAFFIIFIGALLLANLLGRTADKLVKALKMNWVNKIAGAALGMVKALCIISVFLNGIILYDTNDSLIPKESQEKSLLYKPVYATGNELLSSLKEFIEEHPDLTDKIVETGNEASKMADKKTDELNNKKKDNNAGPKGGRK
jgi:membrane protein required for colicin V production